MPMHLTHFLHFIRREASVLDLKSHGELVKNTADKLLAEREYIDEKLATESGSDTERLRSIQASLEKCLELLQLFAGRFKNILSAKSERLRRDMTTRKPGVLARPPANEDVNFSTTGNYVEGDTTKGTLIYDMDPDEKENATKSADSE